MWTVTSCVFEDELVVPDTPPTAPPSTDAPEVPSDPRAASERPSASSSRSDVTLPAEYVVQPGDTLRRIASRVGIYWNESLWSGIYRANTDKIANPDWIQPRMVLAIPPLRDELRDGLWDETVPYENPFESPPSEPVPSASETEEP
jgi:Tfp pilus assembly protein FimV